MKIGVICPSEIALRRFMPALQLCKDFEFVGLGIYDREERFGNEIVAEDVVTATLDNEKKKAQRFVSQYGGKIFSSYKEIVDTDEIEAIYLPLPPALHYKWAKRALEHKKHVFVEKPFSIADNQTRELIDLAKKKGLALHENYMFMFHEQLDAIDKIITSGEIGEVRLYRISFGFPKRMENDFRYKKALGGGALLDTGGYVIGYAARLLGDTARIRYAQMNYIDGFEVDMYGSAAMTNENGVTAQIAFGMDNNYKCELEVWGSKGCLTTGRVITAPVGFVPKVTIRKGNAEEIRDLPSDDSFLKSINYFYNCIVNDSIREKNYQKIYNQEKLMSQFRLFAGR